jgi:hypothetical protein
MGQCQTGEHVVQYISTPPRLGVPTGGQARDVDDVHIGDVEVPLPDFVARDGLGPPTTLIDRLTLTYPTSNRWKISPMISDQLDPVHSRFTFHRLRLVLFVASLDSTRRVSSCE